MLSVSGIKPRTVKNWGKQAKSLNFVLFLLASMGWIETYRPPMLFLKE